MRCWGLCSFKGVWRTSYPEPTEPRYRALEWDMKGCEKPHAYPTRRCLLYNLNVQLSVNGADS